MKNPATTKSTARLLLQNFSQTAALVFVSESAKFPIGWVRQTEEGYETGMGQTVYGSFPTMDEALTDLVGGQTHRREHRQ